MALIVKDRVLESSTSTGTGSFTLTGAQTGYQSFSAIGNGNTTYYTIQGKNPDGTLTGEWEVGEGTWSTSNTLARDIVFANSLGTTAKIAFSAGDKDVFVTYPSSQAVMGYPSAGIVNSTGGEWASSYNVIGTGDVVLNESPTINGSPIIGQHYTTGETVTIATGGEGSIVNIGYPWSDSTAGSSTYIKGNVTLGEDATYDSVTVPVPIYFQSSLLATTANFSSNLTATGNLQLTGSSTANQNIATSQTTGSLTIGGTGASATGAINIGSGTAGQSISIASAASNTGSKTINIASGSSTAAKTINIGTGTATSSTTTIGSTTATTSTVNINGTVGLVGPTNTISISPTQTTGTINIGGTGATGTINLGRPTTGSSQTINIANAVLASGNTQIINVGASAASGSTTTIAIGSTAGTSTTTVNGLLKQQTYTVANLPTGSVGSRSFVTDALAPSFGVAVAGSGAVGVPVYHDGTSWKVG